MYFKNSIILLCCLLFLTHCSIDDDGDICRENICNKIESEIKCAVKIHISANESDSALFIHFHRGLIESSQPIKYYTKASLPDEFNMPCGSYYSAKTIYYKTTSDKKVIRIIAIDGGMASAGTQNICDEEYPCYKDSFTSLDLNLKLNLNSIDMEF
jgi:hypothetical protein